MKETNCACALASPKLFLNKSPKQDIKSGVFSQTKLSISYNLNFQKLAIYSKCGIFKSFEEAWTQVWCKNIRLFRESFPFPRHFFKILFCLLLFQSTPALNLQMLTNERQQKLQFPAEMNHVPICNTASLLLKHTVTSRCHHLHTMLLSLFWITLKFF